MKRVIERDERGTVPHGQGSRLRRHTRSLRDRMPPWSVRLIRRLALGWGMLTARWRLMPDIVVVGAQRAGTTTLFRLLEAHPQLVRPTLAKGTGFFDDDFHRGLRWYAAHFPLRWTARRLTKWGDPRTFECSGYYLFHPLSAERIARYLPDAHVVVMLRDPVERTHSGHRHELARGFEELAFEAAVDAEPSRLAGEEKRLVTVPGSTSFRHRHHAHVGRSRYAAQVARMRDALGPERVHLVEADRFFAEPEKEFRCLQEALGLDPWDCGEVPAWNARRGEPLDPELRERLRAEFAADDDQLAHWLGHPPIWRQEG